MLLMTVSIKIFNFVSSSRPSSISSLQSYTQRNFTILFMVLYILLLQQWNFYWYGCRYRDRESAKGLLSILMGAKKKRLQCSLSFSSIKSSRNETLLFFSLIGNGKRQWFSIYVMLCQEKKEQSQLCVRKYFCILWDMAHDFSSQQSYNRFYFFFPSPFFE